MGIDLGQIELLICWQSMLLATVIYTVVRSAKSGLYIIAGNSEMRRLLVKHVFLPLTPLAVGGIIAVFWPFRPEALLAESGKGHINQIYAAYGVVVGQFSDYIHSRIQDALRLKQGLSDIKKAKEISNEEPA